METFNGSQKCKNNDPEAIKFLGVLGLLADILDVIVYDSVDIYPYVIPEPYVDWLKITLPPRFKRKRHNRIDTYVAFVFWKKNVITLKFVWNGEKNICAFTNFAFSPYFTIVFFYIFLDDL